jgi:hypothetical protein
MDTPQDRAGLVRVMALGMAGEWPEMLTDAELARRILATIEAAGCSVVPAEATPAMRRAAGDALRKLLSPLTEAERTERYGPAIATGHRVPSAEKHAVRWAAMRAASPFAPPQREDAT